MSGQGWTARNSSRETLSTIDALDLIAHRQTTNVGDCAGRPSRHADDVGRVVAVFFFLECYAGDPDLCDRCVVLRCACAVPASLLANGSLSMSATTGRNPATANTAKMNHASAKRALLAGRGDGVQVWRVLTNATAV